MKLSAIGNRQVAQESYENSTICYIFKEEFENKYLKDKKYRKVRDSCHYAGKYRGAAHSICNWKYSAPKKYPIVFHNGSSYDYDFIMKELADEFKKLLGENTEKYITFPLPIQKEVTRIDKNAEEITKNISYILQFIDSARFMASSLSNLVNNLSERIHNVNLDHKKCDTCGIKYKYCNWSLEYQNFKEGLTEYECLICNKNCQIKFNKKLKKRFFNACKFSNNDNNKFILLLRKKVSLWIYE